MTDFIELKSPHDFICGKCGMDFTYMGRSCGGGPNACGGCASCGLQQHMFYAHLSTGPNP